MAVFYFIFVMSLLSSAEFSAVNHLPETDNVDGTSSLLSSAEFVPVYNRQNIVEFDETSLRPSSSSCKMATVGHLPNLVHGLDATSSWAPRCPSEAGRIPRLIPHPQNCRSLFVCSRGRPTEYFCPEGQVFSATYQGCKKERTCSKENSGELPAFESCPKDWLKEHLFPHPTDCNIYYHCANGIALPRPCPRGLHFNSALQICDWPDNANCKSRVFLLKP